MGKIKSPVMLDKTGKDLVDALHRQNLLLNIIAGGSIETTLSIEELGRIARTGNANKVLNVGDQIILPWTDKASNITYQVPHDIVHFGNATLRSGEQVPAIFLQWHYATPFGVQFDAREAMYVVPAGGLAAGTYTFNVPSAWNKILAGDYQFTTTVAHTEGQHFVLREAYVDVNAGLTGGYIDVYADGSSTTVIASYQISSGNSGTSLGQFKAAGDTNLWSMHAACYGYNRWAKSAIRQWLNSGANPEAWWASQHTYDRRPSELSTKHGFMSGYDEEFLKILSNVKVDTALNTVTDDSVEEDHLETTYDKFFLPALVNMHINPQLAGEGDIFDYWLTASQSSSPLAQGGTYPHMRTFAIENHTSPQFVRLRSASRGSALSAWGVYSSGVVNYIGAAVSYRCAPVCAVTGIPDIT